MFTNKTYIIALLFPFFLTYISCSTDDSSEDNIGIQDDTDEPDDNDDNGDDGGDDNDDNGDDGGDDGDNDGDGNNANGFCEEGKTAVFIEKDGVLTIEAENSDFEDSPWSLEESITDFSGEGYIVWGGDNLFGSPGNGLLTYTIRISTPGTYRFLWRSYITIGDDNTEHNDSWLRIPDAAHFYGLRNDGHIVYPKGSTLDPIPESEGQTSTDPEGAGRDGWFKIFMNTANAWRWQSRTSDSDAHEIFVIFDTAGDYTIEISGRSNGHGIDKFVLFTDDTSQADATENNTTISDISCE